MSTVIQLDQVTKRFGSTTALDDVSLDVPPGVVFALLGENRAGKTTAIRVLLGLEEPTSGLDTMVRREFLESMVDLAAQGQTVLLSSHQIREVERVADIVAMVHRGRSTHPSFGDLFGRNTAGCAASGSAWQCSRYCWTYWLSLLGRQTPIWEMCRGSCLVSCSRSRLARVRCTQLVRQL